MTITIDDDNSEYEFNLRAARSGRISSQKLADVGLADDVTPGQAREGRTKSGASH